MYYPCHVNFTLGKWVCKKFSLWEIIRKCLKTFLWFDTSSPAVVLRVEKWEFTLLVSILCLCLWLHLNCVSQSLQVYQGSPSLIGRTLNRSGHCLVDLVHWSKWKFSNLNNVLKANHAIHLVNGSLHQQDLQVESNWKKILAGLEFLYISRSRFRAKKNPGAKKN